MIKTFRCRETERLFKRYRVDRFLSCERVALRKLAHLNAAVNLSTIAVLAGNNLEALKGDRKGQYSVRINNRWRLCFVWQDGNAYDVEIVDYH